MITFSPIITFSYSKYTSVIKYLIINYTSKIYNKYNTKISEFQKEHVCLSMCIINFSYYYFNNTDYIKQVCKGGTTI